MRVLLFDGQGATQATSSVDPVANLSPLSALFIRQAHDALRTRLANLSPETERALNVGATRSLLKRLREGRLTLPVSDASLLQHPLVGLPSVYVGQVLRLLGQLEAGADWEDSTVDVVGYSSGILSALLVATSFPISAPSPSFQLSFLRNALAIFEISVALGLEAEVSRRLMLEDCGITLDDPLGDCEWSTVVFNTSREALTAKIEAWNVLSGNVLHRVYLTAQTTATCHTISGLPSVLQDFLRCELPEACQLPSSGSHHPFSRASSSTSLRATPRLSKCDRASPISSLSPRRSGLPLPAPRPLPSLTAATLRVSGTTPKRYTPSPSLLPTTKPLGIFTLFHANVPQLVAARDNILKSLFPQNIKSVYGLTPTASSGGPAYLNTDVNFSKQLSMQDETGSLLEGLRINSEFLLYDTRTGLPIPPWLSGKSLVGRILELILLERVEFELVLESIIDKATENEKIGLVSFGPSSGLARVTMRALREKIPAKPCSLIETPTGLSSAPVPKEDTNETRSDGRDTSSVPNDNLIAIVGMAVNFPGARSTSELWSILEQGMNTVEEIPQSRFSVSPYLDGSPDAKPNRKMKTRFGNFLPDGLHDGFDNAFFRISPREARALDPQMRVLMRVGYQAAEAAGLVVDAFTDAGERAEVGEGVLHGEEVGCFVGVATNDYVLNSKNDVGVHYATGTLPAFLAGRLAYSLNLTGPSVVTNTACSSSLVAIHQACRAILAGDCKAALAGGVNVITSPDMYIGLDRGHFLSPTGNCKPWDASADGYCRAEGCGMFVLKSMSDALASSDNILGVIRGTEVNQSSTAVSITRPHAPSQQALIRSLLDNAGLLPEDVSVVEAHGTGTQAGDPEELRSLRAVLSPNGGGGRSIDGMLTITGIKANIGHAEAASGAASLAKVLLMLQEGKIPNQINLDTLNPKIDPLENDFTRINTTGHCIDWVPNVDGRRIALVNNFGAAGSNAAMLVENAPARETQTFPKGAEDHVLIALSAENEAALVRLRDAYIASVTDDNIVDFGYTATARRKLRPWRLAVSANSVGAAVRNLLDARPCMVAASTNGPKKTIFLFSGQGGQHIGMGRQLYHVSRTFRSVINSCHDLLISWGYPGILAIINSEDDISNLQGSDELIAYQCAMFSLECALCSLWESYGVKPDAVAGHSLGEYAALVAAGVLSRKEGLRLVAHRVHLMVQRCAQDVTGMLLVRLPAQIVTDTITSSTNYDGLTVACYNGANDTVVGGPIQQLNGLKAHLEKVGAKCFAVNVPFAYHTSAMEPILADFAIFARRVTFSAPRIPVLSNVTGEVIMAGDAFFDGGYLARHCREPVRFKQGISNLKIAIDIGSVGAFIELGPHPTTLPMISHLTDSSGILAIPSLHKKATPRSTLCSSLSRLFVLQQSIRWGRVYRELYPTSRCVEIPTYPLEETSFWTPYVEETSTSHSIEQPGEDLRKRFPFLGAWINKPSARDGNVSEFETPITQVADYISGHAVASVPLCPASVYYELALSAATCTLEYIQDILDDVLTLSDIQFTHPLVYDSEKPVVIRTSINVHPRGGKHAGTFSISSLLDGNELHVHCTGLFQRRQKNVAVSKLQLHSSHIQRGKLSLLNPVVDTYHETLRTRTIYDLIFPRVVQYSKLYQVISTMTMDTRNGEAIASLRIPVEQAEQRFVAQPVFVDALLHAAGFLINSRAASTDAYICSQVDSAKILCDIDPSATFEIFCETTSVKEGLVLANAWAVQLGESPAVVGHIKRMRFSRVRLSSLQKSLSRSVQTPQATVLPTSSLQPKPVERNISRPVTPALLGSPFRAIQRAATPSSMSSVTAVNHSGNDVGLHVLKCVAEISGVPLANIKPSSNMADLGIDSLLWIELINQLKSIASGHVFEVHELMQCDTVGDLINKVSNSVPVQKPLPGIKQMKQLTPFSTPMIQRIESETPRSELRVSESSPAPVEVRSIIGKVLEIPASELRGEYSLDALGLDSLGSIEALNELQERYNVTLPQDFFREHSTINAVQSYMANLLDPSNVIQEVPAISERTVPINSLLPIQSVTNDQPQLVLIHDGSGLSNCYSRIGSLDRALWGINNPKLFTGETWEGGIGEMAANYAGQIKAISTDKGCILGGWSFGGVVAFHAACQLMHEGVEVAGVILIDSPSPFTQAPLPDAVINKVIGLGSENISSSQQQAKLIQLARIQMSHATDALVAYNPLDFPVIANTLDFPNVVMIRCEDAFPVDDLGPLPKERISFLCDRDEPKAFVSDWEKLTGKRIPILDIPGHHFEPFRTPNVSSLTMQLKEAIAYLETAP